MYANSFLKKTDFFLFIQLSFFLIATAVSAGGGNQPGNASNNFYYIKACILFVPITVVALQLLTKPDIIFYKLHKLISINIYLVFYFMISLISIAFSINQSYSFTRISYTIFELISCSCLLIQYNAKKITSHFITISYITSLVLIFLVIFLTNDLRYYLSDHISIHPNILASFCSHLLILSNIKWIYKKNLVNAIPIILLLIVEIFLFSRSAVLGLIIILFLSPIIMLYKNKLFMAIYLLSMLFISTSLFLLFYINIDSLKWLLELIIRKDTVDSIFTLTNRTILWTRLIDNIDTKIFLFGMGYSIINPKYGIDFGSGILYGAHNMYLSVLLGSGVFALVSLIIYFIKNIIRLSELLVFKNGLIYPIIFSTIYFLINGLTSEEIGINISPSFSYLYLMSNIFLINSKSTYQ
jgi:O-Antigen ligase